MNIFFFDSEKESIHPMRITKQELEQHRNLLFASNHYMFIKDFSKMMCYFTGNRAQDFCRKCFLGFKKSVELKAHAKTCSGFQILTHSAINTIPSSIIKKQAVISTSCAPELSFKCAVLNGLEDKNISWAGMISRDINVSDVKRFEKKNSHISVNIFTCDSNGKIFPVKASNMVKKIHKDLLLIKSKEGNFYHEIVDLCRLVQSQITKGARGGKALLL